MILLSAEVRNARALSMAAPLAFDRPNGSGKWTLFERMRMVQLDDLESRSVSALPMTSPLAFDPWRVNVVHGPNSSGMSTLLETMRMELQSDGPAARDALREFGRIWQEARQ